jgi:hypothetical protein
MADQVSDPMGERPSLSAAGTGNHEKGPLVMVNRLALGVIETGEEAGRCSLGHWLTRSKLSAAIAGALLSF